MQEMLNLENVSDSEVLGFKIIRSLHCNYLFHIAAVGDKDEILAIVYTDLTADEAVELVGILNQPYDLKEVKE